VLPAGNKKGARLPVVEVLSESSDFSGIEVAADEIAECIQNFMQMNPGGASGDTAGSGSLGFGSAVVSFKPVTAGSVASGN
jgi:hypothetical protein